ncbi:MAG: InlB B-repeat-containing protein [Acholeplasmatales bacterium]|jgi:hypothetical protein|nr:InlB B-repeat-containing protein [Acholeplasmatales bacterium]
MKTKTLSFFVTISLLFLIFIFFSCTTKPLTYTITFDSNGGSAVNMQTVKEGYIAVTPKNPTRKDCNFEFWSISKDISSPYNFQTQVTSSITLYAIWDIEVTNENRVFTITWINNDSVIAINKNVPYGTLPSYSGITPTKQSTLEFDYIFESWSPSYYYVFGNETYQAVYTEVPRTYEILFINYDNTVLQSSNELFNTLPIYNEPTPLKESDLIYDYTFFSWDKTITNVTSAAVYTAVFTRTLRKYLITFLNYDNTVLQSSLFSYGEIPYYQEQTPTKESDDNFLYEFVSWDIEIDYVTCDVTYTATYVSIPINN